jgi:hypothetical protein
VVGDGVEGHVVERCVTELVKEFDWAVKDGLVVGLPNFAVGWEGG